jgi:cytoskeletal protein CcmA (bactofilin family)
MQNQHSMIGRSIVIKGEITTSDPLYIDGRVEGSIDAPAQRVTVGREGNVKGDICAREVVIMGNVCGNLNGRDRVEIRSDGWLTGDLAANRLCVEDGAFLKGAINVRKASEIDKSEIPPVAEEEAERRTIESLAVS